MTQAGFSQVVFENFDFFNVQTKYIVSTPQVTPKSKITLFRKPVDKYENDNALGIKYSVPATFSWGGNAEFLLINRSTTHGVWDFSGYQSLSFDINNEIKSSHSSRVVLRIILFDVSNAPPNTKDMLNAEFWVSFQYVLDLDPGWSSYDVPFVAVSKSVAIEKPSSGFWHSDEAGVVGNNKLDLDKIAGIGLEFHMSSPQDSTIADGEILLDNIFLSGKTTTTGVNTEAENPASFRLDQNYPNPFNPTTRISFTITQQDNVKLNVYDILGREVAVLVNRNMVSGDHSVVFDGGNLQSGFYLYRLKAGKFTQTKKMLLVK